MTRYEVQFIMPVDNPVNNVSMTKRKGAFVFFVPINYPDVQKLSLFDLIDAQRRSGLFSLSTPLNTDKESEGKKE